MKSVVKRNVDWLMVKLPFTAENSPPSITKSLALAYALASVLAVLEESLLSCINASGETLGSWKSDLMEGERRMCFSTDYKGSWEKISTPKKKLGITDCLITSYYRCSSTGNVEVLCISEQASFGASSFGILAIIRAIVLIIGVVMILSCRVHNDKWVPVS